ncbi:MAG: hypothetical protein M3N22_06590 [Acidobacteriota bacterium]|nr:hypothetical protein [Acidobacteriota bacterium]
MLDGNHKFSKITVLGIAVLAAATLAIGRPAVAAQDASSAKSDRWLHVRVVNSDAKGEVVRVNIPLELAENVLPAINKEHIHNGKIRIDQAHIQDVDLHALMTAVRNAKDGQYVTITGPDQDVRVSKQGERLYVHVQDKNAENHNGKHGAKAGSSEVEIKVPMRVIDALLSAGKDELDIVAGLHALAAQSDTELVSVKSEENTVRVWLDSKNGGE